MHRERYIQGGGCVVLSRGESMTFRFDTHNLLNLTPNLHFYIKIGKLRVLLLSKYMRNWAI